MGYDNVNSKNDAPLIVLTGKIQNDILYFYCNHFSLYRTFASTTNTTAKESLSFFLNELGNLNPGLKGIIIDVRGNGGGDLVDVDFLIGRMIEKPLHFGYTQYKSNTGRLDFTPWIKAYIMPQIKSSLNLPIIVLSDLYSASVSESIIMAVQTMKNGITVGETTWGATGPIAEREVYNAGGVFSIKDFVIQSSSCKFKYVDQKIYEGVGVPPNISVPYDEGSIKSNKDIQLEHAINLIEQKEKLLDVLRLKNDYLSRYLKE